MNVELFVHMDYGVYHFHDNTLDLFKFKACRWHDGLVFKRWKNFDGKIEMLI